MALTDEDKTWIEQLLDRKLGGFDHRLGGFAELFDQKLRSLAESFDQKLERFAESFDQKLERVETNLLTAFHGWARPVEIRQRAHSGSLRAIEVEIEALTDRVTKLEEKGGAHDQQTN